MVAAHAEAHPKRVYARQRAPPQAGLAQRLKAAGPSGTDWPVPTTAFTLY